MSIKLIIVDDAPFIREVVRHLVADSEIELVGEAKDGQEAVSLAKSTQPDVILMDIVMPVKSGIDATREILEFNPKIKIIACSTLDQPTMVEKALEAGCCQYVVKPFKSKELISVIRQAAGL